jgi:hypothetical protein
LHICIHANSVISFTFSEWVSSNFEVCVKLFLENGEKILAQPAQPSRTTPPPSYPALAPPDPLASSQPRRQRYEAAVQRSSAICLCSHRPLAREVESVGGDLHRLSGTHWNLETSRTAATGRRQGPSLVPRRGSGWRQSGYWSQWVIAS